MLSLIGMGKPLYRPYSSRSAALKIGTVWYSPTAQAP